MNTATAVEDLQLCSFTVSGRLFGVPIEEVKEITSIDQIMTVPHAQESVVGYVNIRGHIHLVLSLRHLMGYSGEEDLSETRRMVVFKPCCGPSFGVLIDEVRDIIRVPADSLVDRRQRDDEPPSGERRGAPSQLIRGVCPLEKELVLVLKGHALLGELDVDE